MLRLSDLSGKLKSLLPLLLCYIGLELDNLLYFFPPSHPYHFKGNATLCPNSFHGSPHTHPLRGPREQDWPEPQEVLRQTYFKFKFHCTLIHLLKVIESSSSSPSRLYFAADIIITLSLAS